MNISTAILSCHCFWSALALPGEVASGLASFCFVGDTEGGLLLFCLGGLTRILVGDTCWPIRRQYCV